MGIQYRLPTPEQIPHDDDRRDVSRLMVRNAREELVGDYDVLFHGGLPTLGLIAYAGAVDVTVAKDVVNDTVEGPDLLFAGIVTTAAIVAGAFCARVLRRVDRAHRMIDEFERSNAK